jgi:hypothetical protein
MFSSRQIYEFAQICAKIGYDVRAAIMSGSALERTIAENPYCAPIAYPIILRGIKNLQEDA